MWPIDRRAVEVPLPIFPSPSLPGDSGGIWEVWRERRRVRVAGGQKGREGYGRVRLEEKERRNREVGSEEWCGDGKECGGKEGRKRRNEEGKGVWREGKEEYREVGKEEWSGEGKEVWREGRKEEEECRGKGSVKEKEEWRGKEVWR